MLRDWKSLAVRVTLRKRSDCVPTSPRTHVPSLPCRTVSTRIGSLKKEPLSTWPSLGVETPAMLHPSGAELVNRCSRQSHFSPRPALSPDPSVCLHRPPAQQTVRHQRKVYAIKSDSQMISISFLSLAETGVKPAGFYITRPTYSKHYTDCQN